ncbi:MULTISPECIES: hypothetical protein [Lysobacter]|uniref:hypothetical protein n=1 Tax=Lysobacter TaxID=68 RepID=UPI001F1B58A3|nr:MULTISPECIES: hypothetical protein [Lysobacter]UJB21323.1 hypothetical protein L1A79_09830 [Lysobacter capsici]UJQ29561.1 hypothetical protein L2D09_05030 [Lysobacter gummosus]
MKATLAVAAMTICSLSMSASAQIENRDCADSKEQADSHAADLSHYARRLQRCADAKDFSDDCSIEFSRVRNAHDDYESAVSDVSLNCD